jgi:hypothetical protein
LHANKFAGLCLLAGASVDASNGVFGCGRTSLCGPGTPILRFAPAGTGCSNGDVSIGVGAKAVMDAVRCCADTPPH